jgi:hypothetical protein
MASTLEREGMLAVAEFIVPDWGDKVNSGIRLSYRPASQVAWRAGLSTQSGVDFFPPIRNNEFVYSSAHKGGPRSKGTYSLVFTPSNVFFKQGHFEEGSPF